MKRKSDMKNQKIREGDTVQHAVFGRGLVIHDPLMPDISLTGKVKRVQFDSGREIDCMASNLKKL